MESSTNQTYFEIAGWIWLLYIWYLDWTRNNMHAPTKREDASWSSIYLLLSPVFEASRSTIAHLMRRPLVTRENPLNDEVLSNWLCRGMWTAIARWRTSSARWGERARGSVNTSLLRFPFKGFPGEHALSRSGWFLF